MKIRPLFDKYQKHLVSFANSSIGHLYLHTENLPVVKVAPDGIHYAQEVKNGKISKVKAVFHPRSPYLKKFGLALTALEIASESFDFLKSLDKPEVIAHFLGLETYRSLPLVMLATGTFYPDANVETTTVDGNVARTGVNETFGTIRAGAGTTAEPSAANGDVFIRATATSNQYQSLYRNIDLFDTSSIGASATIDSATVSLYGRAASATDLGAMGGVSLVASTPASNTELVTADFAQLGSTKLANDFTITSWNASAYNDWTMNASGLAAISKTGVTKLGFMFGNDISNTNPTWATSPATTQISFYNADQATTANDPKLVVNYSFLGGSPIFFGNTAIA